MNYTELAASILSTSGRYDLQNTDGSDNGLLKYINRAQRFLDRKVNIAALESRYYGEITVGEYCVFVSDCRVIESVWLLPLTEGDVRVPLIRVDWETMQIRYGLPVDQQTKGTPTNYALGSFRGYPDPRVSLISNLNIFAGFMDVCSSNDWDINGFFFNPVADKSYSIQVVGKFYTQKFGDVIVDNVTIPITNTFWSERYPELLEFATRYWMEVDNRNSEGQKDWRLVIDDMIMDIDFDNVERTVNDELVMGEELL